MIFKLLGAEDPSDPSTSSSHPFAVPASPFSSSPGSGDSGPISGGGGGGSGGGLKNGSNDVIWVLRFGGIMAAIGAVVSRRLLKTKSELSYRRFLERGVKAGEGAGQEYGEEDE